MNEAELKKLYCDVVREEIDFDDLRREKEAFIQKHFAVAPVELFHIGFAVPALCLCLAVAFFMMPFAKPLTEKSQKAHLAEIASTVLPESANVSSIETEEMLTYKEVLEEQMNDQKDLENVKLVAVTRLTSQVGSTMFYQRIMNDKNVTVVWVFPAGLA